MSTKQHHFVAYWDAGKKEWCIDNDTCDARFDEGTVWDPVTDSWESVSDADEGEDIAAYRDLKLRLSGTAQIT